MKVCWQHKIMNQNGNKLIESYSNLIGEEIIPNSDEYAKIKLTEKIFNQRRIDLEESVKSTSLNSTEFIQLQENLSKKGYFKDSTYTHLKNQIKTNIKPFSLGIIIISIIMPVFYIERLTLRGEENFIDVKIFKSINMLNEEKLNIESLDPKALANVITNRALEIGLETNSKLINESIVLKIFGFKNSPLENQFKKDIGITSDNLNSVTINIKEKK
jgi:hypothetical protein